MFGNPEETPGGKALKFYASVRIDLRRTAQIKQGENIIGNRVKAKVVKNKVAPPFKIAEFDIIYGFGVSYESDLLNTGVKYNILKRAGSWYVYNEQKLGQGTEQAKQFLKENPKLIAELTKKVREAAKEIS